MSLATGFADYVAGSDLRASWVQANTIDCGSRVRFGGTEVSSTVGYPIPPGSSLLLPPQGADEMAFYNLSASSVYVAIGDTLYLLKA